MIVEQLEEKIKVLTTNYSNLELDLKSCKTSEKDIIQARTRSQLETKKLEDKNLKCRSDNISKRELILELKQKQTKLSSELETYKNISQRELTDCNAQLKKYESVGPSWIQVCKQFSWCSRSGK